MAMTPRLTAMALAALLGGCTVVPNVDEAVVYDLREERAPVGTPAPAVFVMEKDGATIAVFGTTHLVPARMTWMSAATEQALRSADLILTETSLFRYDEAAISDDEAALLAPRSMLPPGQTLWAEADKRLGAAGTAKIKAALAAHELSPASYTAMRPWMVCRDLQIPPRLRTSVTADDMEMVKALSAAFGAPDVAAPDLKVELYGASNGIETRFLESEYRRAYNFSRLSDAAALDCAAKASERIGRPRSGKAIAEQYHGLLDLWLSGDVNRSRAMIERDQRAINPDWSRLFLQAREDAWIEQIAELCAAPRRNCFVAVGMGHLGGADGLLKQIERLGYRAVSQPQG